jgi:hypothetical protein
VKIPGHFFYFSGPQNLFGFDDSFVEYAADKIAELLGS